MSKFLGEFDVAVIGGGAAGLFVASQLKSGVNCAILECNDRVGKKLLATGNGKCNLSAYPLDFSKYNNPEFAKSIISQCDFERTSAIFAQMGLLIKNVDGRVYPYSESAATVLETLRRAVAGKGAQTFTSCRVESINRPANGFELVGEGAKFTLKCKKVVLATGSDATFGRDSASLYERAFGHSSTPRWPSLVPIRTERRAVKGLDGVRAKVALTLNGRRECGEALFKDFGISGIAAFNLSAMIARGRVGVGDVIYVDFLPEYGENEVAQWLETHMCGDVTAALAGMLHSRIAARIYDEAKDYSHDARKVARLLKNYPLTVEGLCDRSLAQVMCGGLDVEQFDLNLDSKLAEGAYAVGEALDIDGECGGYNLQWAWSSAYVAARHMNENLK